MNEPGEPEPRPERHSRDPGDHRVPSRRPDGDVGAAAQTRALILLATGIVLAMGLWFSASAAIPALRQEWNLSTSSAAWLTGLVQVGFVSGALVSALLNLADRIGTRLLIGGAAAAGAVANLTVAMWAHGLAVVLPLQFLTGFFLAGVYPPGLKLVASWFRRGRGFATGVVVGALTLGSGFPYLLNAAVTLPWRQTLAVGSILAVAGAVFLASVAPGPFLGGSPPLDLRHAMRAVTDPALRLANLGYFGHMWELYAVWAWLPSFLAAATGGGRNTSLWSFAAIGVAGLLGCVTAGYVADRIGRTAVTIVALAISGACCALSAIAFAAPVPLLIAFACVWGFSVIADSAQFSAAVAELSDPRYVGTMLSIQTAVGFLLTVGSIRLVGVLEQWLGWRFAFLPLVLGPVVGILAMRRLRALPASTQLASGHR